MEQMKVFSHLLCDISYNYNVENKISMFQGMCGTSKNVKIKV